MVGACAALGIVLGAAYMLWLYQRVFFGPLDEPGEPGLQDLNRPRDPLSRAAGHRSASGSASTRSRSSRVLEKPVNYVVAKVDPTYATAVAAAPAVPAAATRCRSRRRRE